MAPQTSTEFCIGSSCDGTTLDSSDQDAWNATDVNSNSVTNSSAGNFFPNSTSETIQFQGPSPLADSISQVSMYCHMIIIPVGGILNLFCFIVFVKSKTVKTATGIHLTFLTFADGLVLLSSFTYGTEQWSKYIAIPDLRNLSTFTCKFGFYTINVAFLWSGLLLASASFERFLSVAFPLKVQSWRLYKISKILMIVYLVGSLVLCSYSFLCHELVPLKNGINACLYTQKEINVQICNISDTIVNMVLSNMACILVIFIFTVMISTRLLKYRRRRSELGNENDSGKEFQITLMLVIVATLFLILRIPEVILYQMVYFFLAEDALNPMLNDVFTIYPIFVSFLLLNHSVNFFIYMTFFENFRQTFKRLFICRKPGTVKRSESSFRETILSSVRSVGETVDNSKNSG